MLKILSIIILVLAITLQVGTSVEIENQPPIVIPVILAVILVYTLISDVSDASIAGVTYMDKFDFESRYRNHHNCDPLYWHPLHLPDYCASMYAKLISSRLANPYPLHLFDPVEEQRSYHRNNEESEHEEMEDEETEYEKSEPQQQSKEKTYDDYDKLMKALYPDGKAFRGDPSYAYSNLGPVAVYHHPVSKKSGDMIMKMARSPTDTKHKTKRRKKRRRLRKKMIKKLVKSRRPQNKLKVVPSNRPPNKNGKKRRVKPQNVHLKIPA